MTSRTIVKIVFLVIMSICAIISVCAGLFVNRNNKKNPNKQVNVSKGIVRIRMACFLLMLVCLFICVVI